MNQAAREETTAFSLAFLSWRAASQTLNVADADRLIQVVQNVVCAVVEARETDPDHAALRRLGAATLLGLDPGHPRAGLAALDEAERRGSLRHPAIGDAARQELIEALAAQEGWGKPLPVSPPLAPAAPSVLAPAVVTSEEPPPPLERPSAPPPPPSPSLRARIARRAVAWTRRALDRTGLRSPQ